MKKLQNSFLLAAFMAFLVAFALVGPTPAFAQGLEKGRQALNNVQTWLLSIAGVAVTIAFMWVGFKMIFHAATFKDVAPVFWGAILIAAASGISALLLA